MPTNVPESMPPGTYSIPPGWERDEIIQRIPPDAIQVVSDVANIFHVAPNTVLDWIESGDLPATNVSTTPKPYWKILRRDIIAFRIARHSLTPKPETAKKGTQRNAPKNK